LADPDVFIALADPTRRQLIEWLSSEGSGTATSFAERLPMSRQAVARHLKELEAAGVVSGTKQGRETRFTLRTESFDEASDWLAQRTAAWDRTLGRLRDSLGE